MNIGETVLIDKSGHEHDGEEAMVFGFAGEKVQIELERTAPRYWFFLTSKKERFKTYIHRDNLIKTSFYDEIQEAKDKRDQEAQDIVDLVKAKSVASYQKAEKELEKKEEELKSLLKKQNRQVLSIWKQIEENYVFKFDYNPSYSWRKSFEGKISKKDDALSITWEKTIEADTLVDFLKGCLFAIREKEEGESIIKKVKDGDFIIKDPKKVARKTAPRKKVKV